MRSICTTVAITAAGLLLFSGFAQASDVEAELRQMQERIAELEGQIGNETDSFLPTQEEAGSAVSAMLENTDISGFAAASYNYNFENFDNGELAGNGGGNFNPSHTQSNTFAVDQVFISINNAATEDSRGGVQVEYEWGTVNGAGTGGALYTANVSYLAAIGNGVTFTAGLLPTLVGAEVNQTNANLNVTRGQVWALQPVTHTGVVASTNLTDEVSMSFGVLNHPTAAGLIVDTDNEKAITGQLGWTGEDTTASFQFTWGGFAGTGADLEVGTYDVLLTHTGIEDVTAWANYTLVNSDFDGGDGQTHGIAAAARMAMSEKCGLALRGEAVIIDFPGLETETYSVTTTGDYALSNQLTAKGEVRFDIAPDDILANGEDFAALVLAQLVYEF